MTLIEIMMALTILALFFTGWAQDRRIDKLEKCIRYLENR